MQELQINPKFKDLIPPLDFEEYENLRESLKNEGCRDALIIWDGVIVDGHNRYEICMELGIPFNTLEMSFDSEDDALLWIMRNQLSRRNLCDVDRGRIALKMKDLVAARAREKQLSTLKQNTVCPNLDKRSIDTKKELAKMAGISHGTLCKIEKVDNEAPAPIREAMGKTISIDKAAQLNNRLRQVPETERETEAERLIMEALAEKEKRIDYEEKIAKTLCNVIGAAAGVYEYITPECVEIYLKRTPASVSRIKSNIDYGVSLLLKLKELIAALGGTREENDEQ